MSGYKFKKGDRVIATRDGYYHKKGEFGTVEENNSSCPYVKWDNGRTDATEQVAIELINSDLENYQIY